MSNSGKFGRWVTAAAAKHPGPAKIIAWAIVVAIILLGGWAIWKDLSQGRYIKFAIISSITLYGGLKAHRNAKQAQQALGADQV
jgi:hypothetical protein